jgi:hypothetical protein
MGTAMFDQFKQMLIQSVQDPDFRRKNAIFQDGAYLQNVVDRIESLTADVALSQKFEDVISVLGMMDQDPASNSIKFDTRGFDTTLSAFREGVLSNPRKIWRRVVAGNDERYLISDRVGGVLVLNQDVEVLHRFPKFGPDIAGADEYNDPSACCTFSIGGTEYIAITMFSHHICSIYEYASPNNMVSSIGQLDTPGSTADYLTDPVAVACDEANARLYIVSREGQPAGSTLNRGFVSVYDISVPAAPVFIENTLFYINTGSLLDVEVDTPEDAFFDEGLLWITNGNNEVAAFDTTGTTLRCLKYIEPTGAGYALHGPQQVFVHEALGGFKKIYVSNGAAGLVEEFEHRTLRHVKTYGYRALEDELNSLNRMSTSVYGAIGYAQGVVADRVFLNGTEETDVMICADTLNKRLHRFNLNAYTVDNLANFGLLTFDVPVSIQGWTISGDIPTDMVAVYYRFSEEEEFRELNCNASGLQPTSTVQFRIVVTLDSHRFVREWFIRELVIHGTQA